MQIIKEAQFTSNRSIKIGEQRMGVKRSRFKWNWIGLIFNLVGLKINPYKLMLD